MSTMNAQQLDMRLRLAALRIEIDRNCDTVGAIMRRNDEIAKELETLTVELAAAGVDVTVPQPILPRRPLRMEIL
jgi:hypothetical protein